MVFLFVTSKLGNFVIYMNILFKNVFVWVWSHLHFLRSYSRNTYLKKVVTVLQPLSYVRWTRLHFFINLGRKCCGLDAFTHSSKNKYCCGGVQLFPSGAPGSRWSSTANEILYKLIMLSEKHETMCFPTKNISLLFM